MSKEGDITRDTAEILKIINNSIKNFLPINLKT